MSDKTALNRKCPNCGTGIESVEYREEVLSVRTAVEVRDGVLIFESHSQMYWDCSSDERICCNDCDYEVRPDSDDWPKVEFE